MMLFAILFLISNAHADQTRIRKVEVRGDQIVQVKTALGVATIIQVPDRPASLVVGDSEAFKIEYLDQAITIKPLRSNAKSNLYIFTDWTRFNVQLTTTTEAGADYVVYLNTFVKKEKAIDPIEWKQLGIKAEQGDVSALVKRVGLLKNDSFFIEMTFLGNKLSVDPKWVWLKQGRNEKPIHRLLFSSLNASTERPIEALVQVKLSDLNRRDDLEIEIRRQKTLSIKIPREVLWK